MHLHTETHTYKYADTHEDNKETSMHARKNILHSTTDLKMRVCSHTHPISYAQTQRAHTPKLKLDSHWGGNKDDNEFGN